MAERKKFRREIVLLIYILRRGAGVFSGDFGAQDSAATEPNVTLICNLP